MVKLIKRSRLYKENEVNPLKKFLTFILGKDVFAIDLLKIQEIKNMEMSISKIHDAPSYVIGMVNLHNNIIPIINLGIFFHIESTVPSALNAIIVIHFNHSFLGIIVDTVLDIIELSLPEIRQTPQFFSIINHGYVDGVAELNQQLITILNMDKLLEIEQLKLPD